MLGIFADPTNTTDSPDLGPPPIAHFDEGDPIKFDAPQELSPQDRLAESTDEVQPKLSANLETRKKRRESSHRRDVGVKNVNADLAKHTTSAATAIPPSQPFKTGAKRKLNARDEDDQPTIVEPEDEGHQLSARSSELGMSESVIARPNPSVVAKATRDKALGAIFPSNSSRDGKEKTSGASATIMANGRKALGPSECCAGCKLKRF